MPMTHILSAKGWLISERLGHALAGGFVGDVGRAAGQARGDDLHADGLAGADIKVVEVVQSCWEPLVPRRILHATAFENPVDTSLEDGWKYRQRGENFRRQVVRTDRYRKCHRRYRPTRHHRIGYRSFRLLGRQRLGSWLWLAPV